MFAVCLKICEEKVEKNQCKTFTDLIQDRVAFNMLMVSLISADTLLTADECKQSLNWLDNISEAINCNEIPEERKKYVKSTLERSYGIVNTHLKHFKEKK